MRSHANPSCRHVGSAITARLDHRRGIGTGLSASGTDPWNNEQDQDEAKETNKGQHSEEGPEEKGCAR